MSTRIKLGDLIEFQSEDGDYRYAQITHKEKEYGYLLTLFKSSHEHPLEKFDDVLNDDVQLRTFYFLQLSLKKGLVKKVGNYAIRKDLKPLPRFKGLLPLQFSKGLYKWAIWENGVTIKEYSEDISREEQRYPMLRIIDHDTLLYYIGLGWTDGYLPYKDNEFGTGKNWRFENQV